MRSLDNTNRPRTLIERLLRGTALVALVMLFAHAMYASRTRPAGRAEGSAVVQSLTSWSTREAPSRVHVAFDPAPTPEIRDWLAAIGQAGTHVTWGGAAPATSALTVEPVPDPWRPTRIWISAPAGSRVVLRDELGLVDTAAVERFGARLVVPHLEGTLHAANADLKATSAERDSLLLRPVLILGQAGWEAKFTAVALEEHGWRVEARLAVAPTGDVRQGAARLVIDTTRYAAVIAIDSVANRYAFQLARYVRAGGGLVATGEAAALASIGAILPAAVIDRPTLPGVFARESSRASLALAPLGRIKAGALVLETQDERDAVAAVAWRVGNGRVIQIGYHDTWRWRLAVADPDALQAHRTWWADIVSGVAYAPRVAIPIVQRLEPTPRASLIETLGPAAVRPAVRASLLDDPRLATVLFAMLLGALLLEWTSRRLRGAK